jgi:MFS family permease
LTVIDGQTVSVGNGVAQKAMQKAPGTASTGIGVVNVVLTIVSLRLIDRVGRRVLLLSGLVGMASSLGLLAVGFAFGADSSLFK